MDSQKAIFKPIKIEDPLKGIWNLRKVVSSCKQLGSVSTCLRPKNIKCFQNVGNHREDKNGHKWTTFAFDNC